VTLDVLAAQVVVESCVLLQQVVPALAYMKQVVNLQH
jgi:hypothetical protein